MYVRKLDATFFKHNDGLLESKPPLEESGFMHYVLPRPFTAVGLLVFGSHHQKRKTGLAEQLGQTLLCADASSRFGVKLDTSKMKPAF